MAAQRSLTILAQDTHCLCTIDGVDCYDVMSFTDDDNHDDSDNNDDDGCGGGGNDGGDGGFWPEPHEDTTCMMIN